MPYLNLAFSSHFERMTGKMTGKIIGRRLVDDWKISGIFPVVTVTYQFTPTLLIWNSFIQNMSFSYVRGYLRFHGLHRPSGPI